MEFANFGGLFCPSIPLISTHKMTIHSLYQAGWKQIHHRMISTTLHRADMPCIMSNDNPPQYGKGRENHLYIDSLSWDVIVVDNHHYVLPWRCHRSLSYQQHNPLTHIIVIHLDSHADLGTNSVPFPIHGTQQDWRKYTSNECTIATFINPARNAGIISDCIQVRSLYTLQELVQSHPNDNTVYIIDIDCDFWDKVGWINDKHHALTALSRLFTSYPILGIDIATSPLFLDQNLARIICCTLVHMIGDISHSSYKR